jgi:cell division protein FtsA
MALRLEEIFQLVAQDVAQAGLLDHLRAGVFLCGGGSRIPEITQLAAQILQMPTTVATSTAISGLKSTLDQPEFATGIGLVKFGSLKNRRQEKPSLVKNLKHAFGRFIPR